MGDNRIGTDPTFAEFPERALKRYHEIGFHIEPGLVADEGCDRLIAAGMAIDGGPEYSPIPLPHRLDETFLIAMRAPRIVEIVEKIVGGRASGLGGEFFFTAPGTKGFAAHQENIYVEAPSDAFLSAWCALCDIGPENGGLFVYPESHKRGLLEVQKPRIDDAGPGQNPGARQLECVTPNGLVKRDLNIPKGSVLFFHALLIHGSNDNASDRFRYSNLITYIRSGEPFRAGNVQRRTEVDLRDRAEDIARMAQ